MSAQDEFVMECTICFNGFDLSQNFPRILPCGHTFCSECLARLVQADSSLKCPNCNSKIQKIILEAIPRNFNFMEILEKRQKPAVEKIRCVKPARVMTMWPPISAWSVKSLPAVRW